MLTIWGVMIVTLLLILLAEHTKIIYNNQIIAVNPLKEPKNSNFFYYVAISVSVFFSGLRSSVGDTGYYMYTFDNLPNNFQNIFSQRDWGFVLYQYIIRLVFPHPQALLVITSLLTIFLIFITLKKYSPNIIFSAFLFFVGGTYISSMNGIRQYLVGAVLFYASSLIFQGEKTKFFFIVMVAATFHNSALIMLPIYYIVRQKAWTLRTYLLLIIVLVGFLGFNTFFNMLSPLLVATQYSNYVDNILTESDQGAHVARVLISFIPVFLSFICQKKLKTQLPNYNIYVNISLLNFIVISFASYHWIFARLNIYFGLYNLILLPAILYHCFDKKNRILVYYLSICFYLIYFYFDLQQHVYGSYYLDINRDLIGPLTRTFYN